MGTGTALRTALLGVILTAAASGDTSRPQDLALLGHWSFDRGDASDSSLWKQHGTSHGVTFEAGCAVFDQRDHIEIPTRAFDTARGFRTIEIEVRVWLENPATYYNTIASHALFVTAVHALGSSKGRPCFNFPTLVSDLAPEEGGDTRWGKGPPLQDDTKDRFYYWGWIGIGSSEIPAQKWVVLKTTYDGKVVRQYVAGTLTATHAIRNTGARIAAADGTPTGSMLLGRHRPDKEGEHPFRGKLDYVRVRGVR